MYVRRLIISLLCLFAFAGATKAAAPLSGKATMSMLTCGTGKQIHALYGHSAIRVKDRGFDIIFNYGVFSFNAPNFVYRFAKGETDYMLAVSNFSDFMAEYQYLQRSVCEQVLNLTHAEKQRLFNALVENAKPENREYRYNFFFDNCATRVRDVIEENVDGEIKYGDEANSGQTFRDLINFYQRPLPWINLGIDLLIASPADRKASFYEEMFLPEYMKKHYEKAVILSEGMERSLVKKERILYGPLKEVSVPLNTPTMIFAVLALVVVLFSLHDWHRRKERAWLDVLLYGFAGVMGLVMLWFVLCSEHPAIRLNYNLLWAFPLHLFFAFMWLVKCWRQQLKYYHLFTSLLLIFFFVGSLLFLPQCFNTSIYLISLMLFSRSLIHALKVVREFRSKI